MPDHENAQIYYSDTIAEISDLETGNKQVDFKFTTDRQGLDSISLWLSTADNQITHQNTAILLFVTLKADSTPESNLFQAAYEIPHSGFDGPFRISFPRRNEEGLQTYTLSLTATGGAIKLKGSSSDRKFNSIILVDHKKIDGDPSYSLTHNFNLTANLIDIDRIIPSIILFFRLFAVLLLPGLLLLNVLNISSRLWVWEQAAISIGISLAIWPLILLWSQITSFSWDTQKVNGLILFLMVAYLIRLIQSRPWTIKIEKIDLLFALVILVAGFVRIAMVANISFPFWVDSVHHAYITRLIIEQGHLPLTYGPTFDFPVSTYHPGYHSGLAVFQWISRTNLPFGMLIYGQALNLAAVISAGVFTAALSGNKWAAVPAALAAGLLFPLPSYLTSWGRYTHLTGLIILVSIVVLLEKHHFSFHAIKKVTHTFSKISQHLFIVAVGFAGLCLVHYRVTAHLVLLWVAQLIFFVRDPKQLIRKISLFSSTVILGLLFTFPLMIPAVIDVIRPRMLFKGSNQTKFFADFDFSILTSGLGYFVLILAGIGLIILLWKRIRLGLIIFTWILLLLILGNLSAFGVPGGGLDNNISIEITLFLPISFLASFGSIESIKLISRLIPIRSKRFTAVFFIILVSILSLSGIQKLLPILNPATTLATSDDLYAINWIDKNIPEDANFLINQRLWGYNLFAGSDGGYWINALTNRKTLPPPVLYGFGSPDEIKRVTELGQEVLQISNDPKKVSDLMGKNGLDYIYIGSRGGIFSTDSFINSKYFSSVFQYHDIYIFQVVK